MMRIKWKMNQDKMKCELKWNEIWIKMKWVVNKKEKKYEIKSNETCRKKVKWKK